MARVAFSPPAAKTNRWAAPLQPRSFTLLKIIHKNDGYWLSIDGPKNARINLGEHGPLVTAALEQAAQQGVQADAALTLAFRRGGNLSTAAGSGG